MTRKVETSTINREIRKTMIAVLVVEVTASITHINSQQTKPLKMTWKIRPYKQRQERFEMVETINYGESETNNNEEQNEHNHNCARYARCSKQPS